MKALLGGFFGVFAVTLGLGFFITYPAAFWIAITILVGAFVFGLIQGNGQKTLGSSEQMRRQAQAMNQEEEYIEVQRPQRRAPLVAPAVIPIAQDLNNADAEMVDPEIREAAEMYYDRDSDYGDSDEEQ